MLTRPRPYHFRTREGAEVDLILETPDGRVVGIQVKSASTVNSGDFKGLRQLQAAVGDRFCAGVVLYTGSQTLPFGDQLRVTPISALWEA